MSGYIAIHRQILDSEIFASEKGFKIWMWLLLKARHSSGFVPVVVGNGQQTIQLKRGQLLFGRFKAEEELNINGSTIYKWLKTLEEKKMISLESSSHYTIISIVKYEDYQEQSSSKQTANEQHGSSTVAAPQQHGNTYKNDNNVKKVENGKKKKEEELFEKVQHPLQVFVAEGFPEVSKLRDQLTFEEAGKLVEKIPKSIIQDVLESMENYKPLLKNYKSVYLTINNWSKKRVTDGKQTGKTAGKGFNPGTVRKMFETLAQSEFQNGDGVLPVSDISNGEAGTDAAAHPDD